MRRDYPVFVDLKNAIFVGNSFHIDGKQVNGFDSRIMHVVNGGPLFGSRRPQDILCHVVARIMKNQTMHVLDFWEIWNKLAYRYRSRTICPILPSQHIGMVKATEHRYESDGYLHNYEKNSPEFVKIKKAITKRDLSIEKASKRFLKKIESDRNLRELFYLTSEMEGMTNGTKTWIWREKSNSTREPSRIDWIA